MPYPFPPDVRQLVQERMASGKYASEDELLREALQSLSFEEQDLAAVEQAIDELEQGDPGMPLADALDAIRTKYNISRDA